MENGGPLVPARRVAAYRLGFTRIPAPYGDAAADEALAADVAAGEKPAANRMREYLEARTRFFDRVVVAAIRRGVRQIVVEAVKVRDTAGNHLTDLQVTFRITFPDGEQGDKAREILPDAVRKSHDRLCTVSRTVELGTPIATRIE